MVRKIAQETFDDIVKENIEDLDMAPQEAIDEAVKQLEAQGVNLDNIVKDLILTTLTESAENPLIETIVRLSNACLTTSRVTEICDLLAKLQVQCDAGLAQKVYAGRHGAYNLLLDIYDKFEPDTTITLPVLDNLISLMDGQPDLLDDRGVGFMLRILDECRELGTQRRVLQWIRICCIKHENNRQLIFNSKIFPFLKSMLENGVSSALLVRSVCDVIRALVLDDDIRVEYGNAHNHAASMGAEVLRTITDLLKQHQDDKETVNNLLNTLRALVVKNEFCKDIEEAGGVMFVNDILINFTRDQKLVKQSFHVLKTLARNDEVKAKMIKDGCAPLIVSAMSVNKNVGDVMAAANGCIAALTLRSPENSRALCDAGVADILVDGMKIHRSNLQVQKQGSWAIRNIVSRDRGLCDLFLELGVEDILNDALVQHAGNCDYDIKAALRDLGCNVELTEEWTGKGGALN